MKWLVSISQLYEYFWISFIRAKHKWGKQVHYGIITRGFYVPHLFLARNSKVEYLSLSDIKGTKQGFLKPETSRAKSDHSTLYSSPNCLSLCLPVYTVNKCHKMKTFRNCGISSTECNSPWEIHSNSIPKCQSLVGSVILEITSCWVIPCQLNKAVHHRSWILLKFHLKSLHIVLWRRSKGKIQIPFRLRVIAFQSSKYGLFQGKTVGSTNFEGLFLSK